MELANRDKIYKLINLGGKRWQKGNFDRIYFNDLDKIIKLEHKPSHTTLNGVSIEQARGEEISLTCLRGKFWYDLQKNKFMGRDLSCKADDDIKQMLIDIMSEHLGDNEFTSILSDLDDII